MPDLETVAVFRFFFFFFLTTDFSFFVLFV
jgi:hypothetical protein